MPNYAAFALPIFAWIAWSGWGPSVAAVLAGAILLVSVIARLALPTVE